MGDRDRVPVRGQGSAVVTNPKGDLTTLWEGCRKRRFQEESVEEGSQLRCTPARRQGLKRASSPGVTAGWER